MKDLPHEAPSQFVLRLGERITACFPLFESGSDRMLEEVARCHHCPDPTYRVVAIISAGGLERRAALCVRHFAAAARIFPELKRLSQHLPRSTDLLLQSS